MFSSTLLTTIATSLLYLIPSATAFDINSQDNIALYWGQNSAGSQERLSTYCEDGTGDIFLLSFMTTFSSSDALPELNFASACSSTFSDGLLKCDEIAADIQTCQDNGKKVLLSLGGASGSYGFASDSAAEGFAETLWNMFGGGSSDERPFGDAVIDGFDFDIESGVSTGYAALATKLREYYAEDTSKDYYISAAPQCVYPDASVGDLLANADVDFAFIQFYNNYCNVDKSFNWDTWADYAANASPNSNIKLFLGLPGSSTGASTGYVDVDTVENTALATIAKSSSNFGGIMLWDASQGYANEVNGKTYVKAMKDLLSSGFSGSASASDSSSSSVSISTTASIKTSVEATSSTPITSSSSVETSSTSIANTSSALLETTSAAPIASTSSILPEVPSSAPTETTSSILPEVPSVAPVETTSSVLILSPSTQSVISTPSNIAPTQVLTTVTTDLGTATATLTFSTATIFSDTTLLTIFTTATPTSTSTNTASTSTYQDCSSLTGKSKAQCMNSNFSNGLYSGSADSCSTDGEVSCSADGSFAICNFGKWVNMQCGSGATCYAYSIGDEVDVGCNYIDQKSSFVKRDSTNYITDFFKRSVVGHRHHGH